MVDSSWSISRRPKATQSSWLDYLRKFSYTTRLLAKSFRRRKRTRLHPCTPLVDRSLQPYLARKPILFLHHLLRMNRRPRFVVAAKMFHRFLLLLLWNHHYYSFLLIKRSRHLSRLVSPGTRTFDNRYKLVR